MILEGADLLDFPLIVLLSRRYAYFKGLDYFTTECIYSPEAYRGYARTFIKDLETIRPSSILGEVLTCFRHPAPGANIVVVPDIIHSGEAYSIKESASSATLGERTAVEVGALDFLFTFSHLPGTCRRCGYMSSGEICKACMLLETLSR